ncbi:DUF1266 domain-containing protein [Streptomyces sp. NPDC048172]|uniref:DUF1266 domain-containing protein n=1 Tax=Streptomyces sp. NPDC048172 TaxID=3365505 RepID=UPI0037139C66
MSGAWRAPSALEIQLSEAKLRGDWAAYMDVLTTTRLYHGGEPVAFDTPYGDGHPFYVHWSTEIGAYCVALFTPAMLPAPCPDYVYCSESLGWLADTPLERTAPWIAVNPGTPCEAYFPTGPESRALWRYHAERAPADAGGFRLRTLLVGGVDRGPVAHGLACGALLCVQNGSYWNAMAWHGTGYPGERARLERSWGITTREKWREYQEALLRGEMSSSAWEFVLDARRHIARDFGGYADTDYWRRAVERVFRQRMAAVELTPDGVTRVADRSAAEIDAQVEGLKHLIGRIVRYEARFRADGLLAEGRHVPSITAWDYGRASKMARWGLGARFCTLEEAESATVRAGRVSQADYRSWEEFSAAYILGRCLHFDDEEFGDWYQEALRAHRILTTEPGSPWKTLPFR